MVRKRDWGGKEQYVRTGRTKEQLRNCITWTMKAKSLKGLSDTLGIYVPVLKITGSYNLIIGFCAHLLK